MKKIGLIDGDSLCYISSRESIEESISNIDSLLSNIIKYNNLTHYHIFLSIGKYFRHNVNKDYKGKRTTSTLKYLKTLKSYLIEHYGAHHVNLLEADDLMAYYAKKLRDEKINYVICSPDKDVINQIPGNCFNYKKFEKHKTSITEAYKFLMTQCLMGDSVDNITGIPGVGIKKAETIISACEEDYQKMYHAVMDEYVRHYIHFPTAVYNFQMNFRQVYLLSTDQDLINELGYVPELKEPIEIQNTL